MNVSDDEFRAVKIPENIIFPDELNRYLKDQILVFVRENALLQKNLDESEQKCKKIQNEAENLKAKLKEQEIPTFSSSESINVKILELSKSYRNKCSELEKYKTKCSKLLREIDELKKENNVQEISQRQPPKPNNEPLLLEIKQLQEKINAATNKTLEFKNLNMQLKNELRHSHKLLQQEIGEDFNVAKSNSNWKGRAQIICDLQEKNKKLKEKLKALQDQNPANETTRNQNERISTKILLLEKENAELKTQNDAYKNKIDALKSRCSMLEVEHQELKLRMQNLKEQHAKDVVLISDMSKHLGEAEQLKRGALKEKELEIAKLNAEIENNLAQISNYKKLVDDLKAQINKNQEDGSTNTNKEEASEDEKLKLLDLINLYKKRLETERNQHEKCQQIIRLKKQKTIKLEAAIARSELDMATTSRSGYSTISQSLMRGSENDLQNQLELLEENMKALQTRLLLEQNERRQDFQEFSKILSTSKNK